MFEGDLYLAPDFPLAPPLDYKTYHIFIDDRLPSESPKLYGLHPNAEIDFLTQTNDKLFRTLIEISPRHTNSMIMDEQNRTMSHDEKVIIDLFSFSSILLYKSINQNQIRSVLEELQNHLYDDFNLTELRARVDERNPYAIVALQEAERMNNLLNEMHRQEKQKLDLNENQKNNMSYVYLL